MPRVGDLGEDETRVGYGEALALRASTHGRMVVYQARVS